MLKRLALAAALTLLPGLAAADDRLSVILEWYVNPDHAPMVIAEANGYFADEGLEVELKFFQAFDQLPGNMATDARHMSS